MTESAEHSTDTTHALPPSESVQSAIVATKPNRLYQAAAWVAIVAGTLFIIAVIFGAGFILGRHSDGPGHFGRHMGPPMGPMMHRDGPRWPGGPGPGGPGPAGPTQPPQTPPTR